MLECVVITGEAKLSITEEPDRQNYRLHYNTF